MDLNIYRREEDVRCSKCGAHPQDINFNAVFDYDGEEAFRYGSYKCQCGHSDGFPTNDPYED